MAQIQLPNFAGGLLAMDTAATPNTGVLRDNAGAISGPVSGSSVATTGSLILQGAAHSTAYTVAGTETVSINDATAAGYTITLPAAAASVGRMLIFVKSDASANVVTIDGAGAETISGSATKTLTAQWQALRIWCDGSSWFTI